MGGVAKWIYVDEDSDDVQSGDEEDEAVEENPATPPLVEEPDPEEDVEMNEDALEVEEEEVELTPPRSNGRKAKAPIVSSKKSTPTMKATTRVTKQTAKSPIIAKPKLPAMPKTTSKAPLVSRPKGKEVKGKGKGKGKANEASIYDFDD